MIEIQVGMNLFLQGTDKMRVFGYDEVEKKQREGMKIVAVKPGSLFTSKMGEANGMVELGVTGCAAIIVME